MGMSLQKIHHLHSGTNSLMSISRFLTLFSIFAIAILVGCSESNFTPQARVEPDHNRSIFVYGRDNSSCFTRLYNADVFEKFNVRRPIGSIQNGAEYAVMNESVLRRMGNGMGYCVIRIEVDASDSDILFSLLVL